MAGRVNTKFVFILIAVLVVLVGGIASVAYLTKRDASELVERGEKYLAEGEYKLAVETMERAVGRSKSDPLVIKKFIEVAKQVPAADQIEASNTLQIVRAYSLNLVQVDPNSEEYLREYAEMVKDTIKRIGITGSSHPLHIYQASAARLESNPGDQLARRYRGIYGLIRLNAEMAEEDINLVRDDIQWATEVYPDDPEVIGALVQWKLFEASRLDRPGGDVQRAQQLKDEAVALSKGVSDNDPTDALRKLEYMQVLYRATLDPQAEDRYATIRPILDELESQLLEDPTPQDAVRSVLQNLKQVYAEDLVPEEDSDGQSSALGRNLGVQRSIALLRKAVDRYPDIPIYQLLLGTELKQIGEFDEAKAYIERVKNLSTQGDYLDVLLNYSLSRAALIEYADLLMSLAEKSDTDEQKQARFAQAGKIIEDAVASGRGDEARVLLLKGRLALAQGKTREGLISIDQAADKYDAFSRQKAEALLLSARARGQQGDWGAATERYEQILESNPNIPAIQLTLAGIYIRQQDYDTAQDHIDAVLVEDPTNERAHRQQAALYAAQGDLEQAVTTYRQLDMANRPDLAVELARLMIQGDRKPQAAKMLGLYFDADPADMQVTTLLLYSLEDVDKKQRLIDRSRAAGGDEKLLAAMERQLNPEVAADPGQAIESFVANESDPFLRALSSARLYARVGKQQEAREALARAEAIKPDDRRVVDMSFSFALSDGDVDEAQRLADRAAQMNFDEASGRFYLAQVQSARKDYAGAIETLRNGLKEVPINSEGWRLLGDMYVATSNDSDAVGAYEKSLKQRPDNLGSIRGLAAIRDRQGRYDEALGMLKFAQKQYPNNARLHELYLAYEGKHGDKQLSLRLRRELAQKQPKNLPNKRALALLLAETGHHEQGLAMVNELIEAQGETILNLVILANVHRFAGNPELGEQAIRGYIQAQGSEAKASDYLLLARYLLESNNGEAAVASYQNAIKIESDRREATRELAALYFSRKGYAQALALYRDLHSQFPEETLLGLRLADALISTQDFDGAAEVLDGFDGGPEEDVQRALIEASRGNQAEAIRLVTKAIEADPGKVVFYYKRAALLSTEPDRIGEAIQDLNTALSLNPNHLLSRRLLVGMYMRQGEKREAIREMVTLVSHHPKYAQGRLSLIQFYAQQREFTRAKTLARAGVALSPDIATWHSVLGSLAVQEGDIPGAIESYTKVLEISTTPANLMNLTTIQIENDLATDALSLLREHADIVNKQPLLQAVMGRALYAGGKQDEARQVFTRSLERCEGSEQLFAVAVQVHKDYSLAETISLIDGLTLPMSRAWIDLVLARLEVSDGESQAVIRRLSALESTLSAEDTDVHQVLEQIMGPALHNDGQIEKALVYYRRVQEFAPDNTSVLNNMAYLLAEDLGRLDEALPLAERAAELEPGNAQILDTLGWVQFKLGKTDEAKLVLQSSIDVTDLSANHLHMAELLIEQGYEVEAGRHLKTAIDLAEQNNESEVLERAQELLKRTDELTEAPVTP